MYIYWNVFTCYGTRTQTLQLTSETNESYHHNEIERHKPVKTGVNNTMGIFDVWSLGMIIQVQTFFDKCL